MAAQAVDLDPQESRCHRMLALVCVNRRELATAQRHLDRALQLNPNDADAMQQMGYVLALRGKPQDALVWLERARRLNPLHPTWYNFSLGIALYSLGRYAEAAEAFLHRPNPGPWSSARLAACYAQLGDPANPHISQVSRCAGWVRAGGWFRTWPARVPAAVGGWAGSTMVFLVAGLVESRSQAAAALRNRA